VRQARVADFLRRGLRDAKFQFTSWRDTESDSMKHICQAMQSAYSFDVQFAFINSQNADMRAALVFVVHESDSPLGEVPPIRCVPVDLFADIERMIQIGA
jgi:hypothetical protein